MNTHNLHTDNFLPVCVLISFTTRLWNRTKTTHFIHINFNQTVLLYVTKLIATATATAEQQWQRRRIYSFSQFPAFVHSVTHIRYHAATIPIKFYSIYKNIVCIHWLRVNYYFFAMLMLLLLLFFRVLLVLFFAVSRSLLLFDSITSRTTLKMLTNVTFFISFALIHSLLNKMLSQCDWSVATWIGTDRLYWLFIQLTVCRVIDEYWMNNHSSYFSFFNFFFVRCYCRLRRRHHSVSRHRCCHEWGGSIDIQVSLSHP